MLLTLRILPAFEKFHLGGPRSGFFSRVIGAIALCCCVAPLACAESVSIAEVFNAPECPYAQPLLPDLPKNSDVLRTFQVEERAGVSRRGDLVRVPLFFSEGECRDVQELAIVDADAPTQLIPLQADDIRRGPNGGISRVHLWFAADLTANQTRRYQVVRRSGQKSQSKPLAPMSVEESGNELRFITERGPSVWTRKGELRSLAGSAASLQFDADGAFPRVMVRFPDHEGRKGEETVVDRSTADRLVEWQSGPLFAKLRIRIKGPEGLALEQVYQIPRHGRHLVITSAIFPGERPGGVVRYNRLLNGTLNSAPDNRGIVERAPAGIRYSLRAEHAYTVTALKSSQGEASLLAVPLVVGGPNGLWNANEKGFVGLDGQRGLTRGGEGEKDTLRGFWTQVTLRPLDTSDPESLWRNYMEEVQPLVAVVEEPGATAERLHAALSKLVGEMKPIGWRQEAGRAWVFGDRARVDKILQGGPSARESDRDALLRSARGARAKLTNNGQRKVAEHEKGRAYGPLDPYHITYTQSAAAALAVLGGAPPSVSAVNYAMASAVREEGGRADDHGNPYVDCFNRALNMQVGAVLFGLTAGTEVKDAALVRFYRDLATSPPIQAVFGRAQRPYSSAPAKSAEQSDYLYQAICDFWFRATELLGNEDLSLHPLAFSRYTDCIDVMADLYHGVASSDKPGAKGEARANFFRGQAHTHRWLGWSCAPYIRLLEDSASRPTAGLTEAIHHTLSMSGRWKNWPDLTYYILADRLVMEGLTRYQRPPLPAAPGSVTVRREKAGASLSWPVVEGAAEYRVYRAETAGGPYRWLNSPYLESPAAPLTDTTYHDANSPEKASYVVTAVDAAGRESKWAGAPSSLASP
jgi:hypothetical protein